MELFDCSAVVRSKGEFIPHLLIILDAATDEQKRLLLFESSLLRGMHHRNILSVKSVVLDDVPMVIYPFLEGIIKFTAVFGYTELSRD